jgi:hypothetical protein
MSEDEEEEEMDDTDDIVVTKPAPLYAVGSYVVAVYDDEWYIAQVEAEEPENECPGFLLLKYMERKGPNQFVWGSKDMLKTIDTDILREVEPPIPVSSRLWGLPKDVVKDIDRLMRVKWSIIVLCVTFKADLSFKNSCLSMSPTGTVILHFLNFSFVPMSCPYLELQYCLCFVLFCFLVVNSSQCSIIDHTFELLK